MIECPACGEKNDDKAAKCANCGFQLSASMPSGKGAGVKKPGPSRGVPAGGPGAVCPACGEKNDDKAAKCANCGFPLGDDKPDPHEPKEDKRRKKEEKLRKMEEENRRLIEEEVRRRREEKERGKGAGVKKTGPFRGVPAGGPGAVCPACGEKNGDNAAKCANCGFPLGDDKPDPHEPKEDKRRKFEEKKRRRRDEERRRREEENRRKAEEKQRLGEDKELRQRASIGRKKFGCLIAVGVCVYIAVRACDHIMDAANERKELYARAVAAEENGDYILAVELYKRNEIRNYRDSRDRAISVRRKLLLEQTDSAISRKEWSEAQKTIDQILRDEPDDPDALLRRKKLREIADAQFAEAIDYLGTNAAEDIGRAVECLRGAADLGCAQAQMLLEMCFDIGGETDDVDNPFPRYRMAAEQEIAEVQYRLGECFADGIGIPQNFSEAVKWYRRAAENHHAAAAYRLAECCEKGLGCSQDRALALEWYRKAAEQGDVEAWLRLSEWYRQAAERGGAEDQRRLAECYEKGLWGIRKDPALALEWYRGAAEQGDVESQRRLAECYEKGLGCTEDQAIALEWYRRAAGQGDADAQRRLAEWYLEAAGQGDVEAQRRLAECYEKGLGVTKNTIRAVSWYREAAEQGDVEAQRRLAECYEKGLGGIRDPALALEWYRRAAEHGDVESQRRLDEWYRKAVEQGGAPVQRMPGE